MKRPKQSTVGNAILWLSPLLNISLFVMFLNVTNWVYVSAIASVLLVYGGGLYLLRNEGEGD